MENVLIFGKQCPHCGSKHTTVARFANELGEDKTALGSHLATVYAGLIKKVDQCEKRIKGGQLNLPDTE